MHQRKSRTFKCGHWRLAFQRRNHPKHCPMLPSSQVQCRDWSSIVIVKNPAFHLAALIRGKCQPFTGRRRWIAWYSAIDCEKCLWSLRMWRPKRTPCPALSDWAQPLISMFIKIMKCSYIISVTLCHLNCHHITLEQLQQTVIAHHCCFAIITVVILHREKTT